MDLNGFLSIDELAEIYKNTVLEHGTPGNVIFVVKYGYQMVKNGWRTADILRSLAKLYPKSDFPQENKKFRDIELNQAFAMYDYFESHPEEMHLPGITTIANDYEDAVKFKHILEYFCSHLLYIVTKQEDVPGYDTYLKKYVDQKDFKKSGQGYKGDGIQKQISQWENLSCGKICISVYGASPKGSVTYLHWDKTGHNISANWKNDNIESFQLDEFLSNGNRVSGKKFSIEELGLFDNEAPNENLIQFYKSFVKMLNQHNVVPKYRSYITAIKSKPFLLLAGISGTGKSRIVRELARACWYEHTEEYNEHKPKNFEMVQVKPNWHDSSELIGYVSRVSGKSEYIIGDFLKFIVKAWNDPDVPYFLCLDEMNLAPVEQYFAEFLSVMESRKNVSGKIVTDAIVKKSKDDWYRVLISELTNDKKLQDQFLNEGISIPQNLIVVGTVNMDETTFSFSRKVLDRAMTIEMNEVDLKGGLTNRHENIGKIEFADIIGKAVEGVDVYAAHKGVCDKAITYLKSINAALDKTPFKVAYRTRNELLLYVVNNLSWKTDDELEDFVIARALDEITCMKILTRIEGDETKVSANFLDNLGNAIKSGLVEIDKDLLQANKSHKGDAYQPISLDKLEEMKERQKSGYTSFWS